MANMTDMSAIARGAAILPQSDISLEKQIESPPRTDQSFIIALKTEVAPILQEEYVASMFRATVKHQLLSRGMTTPQNVGLPNTRHDFLPDLGEENPVYAPQAQYMGANNQYQSSYVSDIVSISPNSIFKRSNHYLYHQGPAAPNADNLHDASGSDTSFGLAQYPLGQAPYHHNSFTEMFVLQNAKPTVYPPSPGDYAEPNPPPVYADGNPTGLMAQLHDPSRIEYPSEEELGGLMQVENGLGCMPTITEDDLRIPYIDHKFQHAKKSQLLQQNKPMKLLPVMTDTAIADHAHLADSSLLNSLTAFNEKGVYEHVEPFVPEIAASSSQRGATANEQANAWVDFELVSPNIPPESRLLPQGQSNVLPRVAEIPGFDSLYDPRYERMGLPCDPHIRLLLAVHHGTSGQGLDGNS